MTPDTNDDMATRSTDTKTFRPPVDDYFRRHVRDDHAPNAALHSTLRALADSDASRISNVNLMASHGPGEKDHEPTYEVVVDIENGGAGTAATGGTIVSKLIECGDVVITDAESSSIVPESEAYDGDGDYPTDRLTLRLRPVERRVEPVEVPYRFVPDDFTDIDDLRSDATTTLQTAIDDEGVNDRTRIAAKCLATLLCVAAPDSDYDDVDPDVAPTKEYRDLLDRADVDFDSKSGVSEDTVAAAMRHLRTRLNGEVKGVHPLTVLSDVLEDYDLPIADADEDTPGVEDVETIADCALSKEDVSTFDYDSNKSVYHADVDDAGDAVEAARAILDTFDVDHPVAPSGLAYYGDTRSGVPYDHADAADEGDCTTDDTDGARGLVGALEGLADRCESTAHTYGEDLGEPWRRVASEIRVTLDDYEDIVTTIPCGCGDYAVEIPERATPESIDVVCPECGNHFGHGEAPGDPCPCNHDHEFETIEPKPESIANALPDGWGASTTDVFYSHDMKRYTIDVFNESYGRHRDDRGDVEPGTPAEGVASGLGLAAVAESVDRKDDGGGVDRGDVNRSDEAIGRALYKGTLAYNDAGRLVDNRDAMREGGSE